MRGDGAAGMPAEKKFVSPTQLTNQLRRPKSPRRAVDRDDMRKVQSFQPSLLSAERFRDVPMMEPQSKSFDEATMTRNKPTAEDMRKMLPSLADSFGCSVPSEQQSGGVRTYQSCKPEGENLEELLLNARKAMYEQAKEKGPVARQQVEGCINVAKEHAKIPDEQEVRSCLRQTTAKRLELERWMCHAYNVVQTECYIPPPGEELHVDERDVLSGTASKSTAPIRNTKHVIRNSKPKRKKKEPGFDPILEAEPTPQPFRSPKGVRFPEAARIENPQERREREGKGEDEEMSTSSSPDDGSRQQPSDEEKPPTDEEEAQGIEGINEILDNDGDQPRKMRDYRLKMFQNDRQSKKTVPKARLSRALSELTHQDEAIKSLEKSLEDTKITLGITEQQLIDARETTEKQKMTIAHMRTEAKTERRALEEKLAEESEERSKLQSRVSSLQVETSRLRSALRSAKAESKKNHDKYRDIKRSTGSTMSSLSGEADLGDADDFASIDTEESGLVVALRAEIVNVKAELADARADLVQSGQSSPGTAGSRAELIRLRSKLQSCEAELARLRLNEAKDIKASASIISSLEAKLKEKEDELEEVRQALALAKAVESDLREELEMAKARILELEKEQATSRLTELAEMEQLRKDLAAAHEEVDVAKKNKDATIEIRKNIEIDELRGEVVSMKQRLAESAQHAVFASAERLKERRTLESELQRSQKSVVELQETVVMLQERLAEAEVSGREIVRRSPSFEGRSVKRKIDEDLLEDEEIATRESVNASELVSLRKQLEKTKASEAELKAEVEVIKDLLRVAEASAAESKAEIEEEVRERKEQEAQLAREVQELTRRLEDAERKAMEFFRSKATHNAEKARAAHELQSSKIKEKSLLNDVRVLKMNLERAERRCEEERKRAEEERRLSREVELERLGEVERLRQQIRNVHDNPAIEKVLLQRVRDLEYRLALAEAQVEQSKIDAEKGSRTVDEEALKLRTDLAVAKARQTASRMRSSPSHGTISTDMSTSSYMSSSHDEHSLSYSEMESVQDRSQYTSPPFTPPRTKLFGDGSFYSYSPSPARGPKTPTLRDEDDTPEDEAGAWKPKSPRRVDLTSLERRLEESNQRIQNANIRLKDITSSSDKFMKEQSRVQSECDDLFMKIVDRHQAGFPEDDDWMLADTYSVNSNGSSHRCGSIEEWRVEHGEI